MNLLHITLLPRKLAEEKMVSTKILVENMLPALEYEAWTESMVTLISKRTQFKVRNIFNVTDIANDRIVSKSEHSLYGSKTSFNKGHIQCLS